MRTTRTRLAFLLGLLAFPIPAAVSAQTFTGDFSLSSGAVYQTSDVDEARGIAVDTISVGGPFIYVTGKSNPPGATVKLTSAGVAVTSVAVVAGSTAYGMGVAVDQSGNVWVAGLYVSAGPVTNWIVQKYDSNLVVVATHVVNGISLGDAVATSIAIDGSGNAFVAGYKSNDYRIMKYSPSMVVLASATIGGGATDQANAIALDPSGNVIVTGESDGATADILTVKYNSTLVFLSSAIYDGGATDRGYGATTDPSGNIYVNSDSYSGADGAMRVVKYSPALAQLGTVVYNTTSTDQGNGVMFVGTDTLVAVGGSYYPATEDWLIYEYDSNLVLKSARTYDSGASDHAYAVAKGTGTYMYVAGISYTSPSGAFRTIRMNVSGPGGGGGASPPTAPSGIAGTAQSTSTVLWTWTDNSSDETGFRLIIDTTNVSGDLAANTTTWLQTGLTVNSSSGPVWVRAFNSTGTADSSTLIRYSLTDPPNSITATFFGSSVAFTWPTMTNPANTRWSVERGTDGVSYASQLYFSSAAAAFTDTGLAAQTTYYYRVRSANQDGVYSFHANSSASVYTGGAGYPGCAATNNVGSGQTYATIQAAVNALPSTLTGHSCVVIRDGATYAEQVTVRGFTNNGSTITIRSDPASGLTPVVAPPALSTAAFQVANASVNVLGIDIAPAFAIPYGIFISSAYVSVSGVNVKDAVGRIATAGLAASSWTTVSYTSVTVGGANAIGIWLPGSVMTTISYSSAAANATNAHALRLSGASSNTITYTNLLNLPGVGGYLLNSNFNAISRSSIVCDNGTGIYAALYLTNSSSNSVTQTYLRNSFVDAVSIKSNSNYNTISQSTAILTGAGGQAAIGFTGSSYNSVAGCLLTASGGVGVNLGTSNFNTISQTTMSITNGMGRQALLFNVASSNTVTQCYIANPNDTAVSYFNGAAYNAVDQSTIIGGPSSNANPSGVYITNGSFNTISQSNISNSGGFGATFGSWALRNTISQSTITSAAAGYSALYFVSGSATNTVTGSYVQGSTAAYLTNSQGSAINSSVLVAASATGHALWMTGAGSSLTLTGDTFVGGSLGAGVFLDGNNSGVIALSSGVVTGARYGLLIATQAAGSSLSIASLNFAGLASGATAVNFLGGTFVATITAASFDATAAVNVNGAPLNTASRVSMLGAIGARAGAAYEKDPNALVDWLALALPAAPSGFTGAGQTTSSILWTWTDNSSDETGFRIKFGGTNVSGDLAADATTWLQTGLAINASSGSLLVQAFNSSGTANSGSATRYSLAATPSGLASSSVFQTSATVSWSAGNPAGTVFELERSTGVIFSLVSASSLAAAYADAGLTAAATYYYRVRALNGDSTASAYASSITVVTLQVPGPLAPIGFAGAALSATSILWSWTDNTANESGYRVLTGTISISGDLAANATNWLQTGLSTNTAYGPYSAQAFNAGGTADSLTAARTTLAEAPSGLAASGVYQTSGTMSWSAGGNPAGSTFELERSTGTGFGLRFTGAATSYFDQYLLPSATHFYRVRALNGEGVATAYTSSIAAVALPAPPIPGAAGTPVGSALGVSSAAWTWALASGATYHNLFRASDNSYLGASATGPFVQTALTPNTPYGLRAAGVNLSGTGALSPSATVYTLAAIPAGAAAASITSTTLSLSWGLNGNAAATTAQLERSIDSVAYSTLAAGVLTSYADADLLGCTTYYYRVRNVNGDGLPTGYASFSGVTANTVPGPPAGLTASANAGGTVGLSWGLSPTEGVTGYRLYWDAGSGTVSYGAPLAVLGSTATAFTTGVLTSSASYTFALRTAHRCGLVETTGALAMSGAAVAPPPVRSVIKEPDSGRRISGNRITILGELVSGTPGDVQQVLFQYKLAASTAWLDVSAANINSPNADFDFPYFTHVNVTLLAPGDYDLRAVAYDRNGVPDSAPSAVRVAVDPVAPDIRESLTVEGKIKKDQAVSNAVTSTIETAGAGAADPAVRVSLPPGVVTAATATLSVIANPTITTAAPSGQTMVGSSIKIDLSNGQSALNGTAAITLTYPDTVRFPSLLQIYYLNEATGQWSRDFATAVDTASRTVTGNTPHFSTFALMLGTAFAADLDSVQVYPVPFKPNGSNADEGRPFTAGDANSGIIFSNLAMGAEIKIYTLTGRLVSSIGNPSIAGTVRWDARNQDGRDVASGAYFAVITAGGHKAVVKKLVIIR